MSPPLSSLSLSLSAVTHTYTQSSGLEEKKRCSDGPTVRGWGQVCSSSSMIPRDSWDVAVVPLLCDSASVRRCRSPHHSLSVSFLCSPRPLSALPLLLILSDPLLHRGGGGSQELPLCSHISSHWTLSGSTNTFGWIFTFFPLLLVFMS